MARWKAWLCRLTGAGQQHAGALSASACEPASTDVITPLLSTLTSTSSLPAFGRECSFSPDFLHHLAKFHH
jgi:hypothetical protein